MNEIEVNKFKNGAKSRTLYWMLKSVISAFMIFSAYFSYSHPEALRSLGFPDYFRIELVIAKIIGAIVLLIPQIPSRVKEWVYAGFGISMVSALIAHICTGDAISTIIFVAVDFTLFCLCVQYVYKKEHPPINVA